MIDKLSDSKMKSAYYFSVMALIRDQLKVHMEFHHMNGFEIVQDTPLACGLVPDLQIRKTDEQVGRLVIQFSASADVAVTELKCREIKIACEPAETFIYDYEKGEWVGNSYSAFLNTDLSKLNATE